MFSTQSSMFNLRSIAHAGSIDQKSFTSLLKVWVGMEVSDEHAGSRMTRRERLDLLVLFTTFGVLVGQ